MLKKQIFIIKNMESIGTAFTVFGSIFLVMAIIIYFVMKKTVNNPNCPQEVMAVITTRENWEFFFAFSFSLLLIGAMLLLLA